jgi:hypothetical protein
MARLNWDRSRRERGVARPLVSPPDRLDLGPAPRRKYPKWRTDWHELNERERIRGLGGSFTHPVWLEWKEVGGRQTKAPWLIIDATAGLVPTTNFPVDEEFDDEENPPKGWTPEHDFARVRSVEDGRLNSGSYGRYTVEKREGRWWVSWRRSRKRAEPWPSMPLEACVVFKDATIWGRPEMPIYYKGVRQKGDLMDFLSDRAPSGPVAGGFRLHG